MQSIHQAVLKIQFFIAVLTQVGLIVVPFENLKTKFKLFSSFS